MVIFLSSYTKIPEKTHRFNPDNKYLESIDDYVAVCPNDLEIVLQGDGCVTWQSVNGVKKYKEQAYCTDCGYQVFRRPSEKEIARVEKSLRESIV